MVIPWMKMKEILPTISTTKSPHTSILIETTVSQDVFKRLRCLILDGGSIDKEISSTSEKPAEHSTDNMHEEKCCQSHQKEIERDWCSSLSLFVLKQGMFLTKQKSCRDDTSFVRWHVLGVLNNLCFRDVHPQLLTLYSHTRRSIKITQQQKEVTQYIVK